MKRIGFILALLTTVAGYGQSLPGQPDSLKEYSSEPISVYPEHYMKKYNMAKAVIVKVYPYALHAADLLDEINNNAAGIEKRRQQNKYYKESYENLKDEFKYVFYELYTNEGIMLMKLVYRETGMTVYEIAEKYRGKGQADMFNLMGLVWDQNIKVTYDPEGEDRIAEHVIRDIQSGLIPFNDEPVTMDKLQWKAEQQKDKEREKQNRDNIRERNKNLREREKQQRRDEKENSR